MDIYKILETLQRVSESPTATELGQQKEVAPSANTPQAQAAAKALQAGMLKLKQQYPNLDTTFESGIIKEIRPDGTVVIHAGNGTGAVTRLMALGGGANFKVVADTYEGTQFSFANPKQKPGDQVRGTDVARKNGKKHPFNNRLVGAAESIDREIAEGWSNYLAEFGADNTQSQDPATKQKAAKELDNITKAVSQAKTAGVVPPTLATGQLAKDIATAPDDITKATSQQKKEMGATGDSFNDFIKAASSAPGGQSALNTVLAAMKKVKSQPGI